MKTFTFTRRHVVRIGLGSALVAAAIAWANVNDGALDASFGSNGSRNVAFPNSVNDHLDAARQQADSSFLVAGVARGPDDSSGNSHNHTVYIATVSANGSVIGTPVTQDVAALIDDIRGGSIPSDGRILLGGSSSNSVGFFATLARLNADGSTDASFGRANSANNESACGDVFAEPVSGRIVAACVVGSSGTQVGNRVGVFRFSAALAPDNGFGTGGAALTGSFPTGYTSANEPQGKVLVADAAGNYYLLFRLQGNFNSSGRAQNTAAAIAKFDSAGTAVSGFGSGGIAVLPVAIANDANNRVDTSALALDGNGNLLAAGRIPSSTGDSQFIARINATSGAADTTFGGAGTGVATISNASGSPDIIALLPEASGIYVLDQVILSRLTTAGLPDSGFNSGFSNVGSLNDTSSTDRSTWGGLFAIDANSALLLGGVNGFCVGNNSCGPGGPFTSSDQAVVAKVRLVTDTTPNAFSFTPVNTQAQDATVTSNAVTISGINAPTPISVGGDASSTYSVDGGAFTATAGTIGNGASVRVRHLTASAPATSVSTILTVGGVTGTFTSTTAGTDSTPDAFAFTNQTGVAPGATITSNAVTISGIDTTAPVSVSGAAGSTYSLNSGAFTATAGTVTNGASLRVRHTSASAASTAVSTTLSVGGVTATFTSTTAAPASDTTPNAFSFTAQTGVARSATVTSNTVTIGGIDAPAAVSVSGGSYSIGCTATFTSAAGTISNGQTVCVRQTTSANASTTTTATLTIGGVNGGFSATTAAAPPPPAPAPAPSSGGGGAPSPSLLLPLAALWLFRRRQRHV